MVDRKIIEASGVVLVLILLAGEAQAAEGAGATLDKI